MISLLFFSAVISKPEPSGSLWTLDSRFNFSDYPSIIKDSDFKILQLTDLHIHGLDSDSLNALTVSELLITATSPDLIIMTGDSVCQEYNADSADLLVAFLETFEVPYTMTLGNHDGEGASDDDDIARIYAAGPHSLFDRGPGSIHGFCNSAVHLVNSAGRLVYDLITVDTGRVRTMADGSEEYDYVYPDQSSWYEWFIRGENQTVGDWKAALFYHIPLREINDVQADYERVDPAAAAEAFREASGPSKENSGFWQTVREAGVTTHMFFGHNHRNLVNYTWEGVTWVFGLKTGTSYYHDADRIGGTLITIGQDRHVDIQFIYEVGMGVSRRVKAFAYEWARKVRQT
jgi:3',5'-cyclic AMP phosphodiesterase CpdA